MKYSVEISRYIVTYYKDTVVDPDSGEEHTERKKTFTKLSNLCNSVDFDNFIEENRWINSEIVDILDKIWKALPGKHVYLSRSTSQATLDIKLSNHGFPKTIYRIVYKHYRNDIEDNEPTSYEPIHVPVSDEAKNLIEQINAVRSEFKTELESLYQDGLISKIGTRRVSSSFCSICSSARLRVCTNDNGQSFKKVSEVYEILQRSLKNVDFTLSPILTNSEHFDKINEIIDKMCNLLWDARTEHSQNNLVYITTAINSVKYLRDYIYYMISLKLSDAPIEAYQRTDC